MKLNNYLILTATVITFSLIFSGCDKKSDKNISLDENKNNQEIINPTPIITNSEEENMNNNITPQITQPESIANAAKDSTSSASETMLTLATKNGNIVIKLYDKTTPKTAQNIIKKVKEKFYDGLIFHRVIPGFMAQGGDPTGTGMGGGSMPSELNDLPFKKGSLGLARTPASKEISNDSQFFICFDDFGCQHLKGDYVNFGEVVSGFEALDKVSNGDKIISFTLNK